MGRGHTARLALGRLGSILLVAGIYLFAGVRLVLDLIGYSTVPEDVAVAQTRADQFLGFALSVPWWAIWAFLLITTVLLIWVSWPRPQAETKLNSPADEEAPKPTYASPFAGKTPAVPETIPQRLIDAIDRDDARIEDRIRLHYVEKPITIQMHLDAADPYIDIDVILYNNSVFPVSYSDIDGRFHFKGQPLSSDPQVLDNVTLANDRAGHINPDAVALHPVVGRREAN